MIPFQFDAKGDGTLNPLENLPCHTVQKITGSKRALLREALQTMIERKDKP